MTGGVPTVTLCPESISNTGTPGPRFTKAGFFVLSWLRLLRLFILFAAGGSKPLRTASPDLGAR